MPTAGIHRPPQSIATRLLLAVLLTGAGTPAAWYADSRVESGGFAVLLIVVVIAAFAGGFPAALLTTALCAFSLDYFVLPPLYHLEPTQVSHWLDTAAFLIVALLVSSLYSGARRSEQHVQRLLDGERASTRQLKQLTAELRAANDVKDDFIALVSHELKSPLTTVILDAGFLRRTTTLPTEGAVVLDELEAEALRLAAIIDNLLALARLDRGEAPAREPVALSRLVKRVVLRFQAAHPSREFQPDLNPSVIAEGNAVSIEQVLQNLVSNADKYSPADRPIAISVSASSGESIVEVSDAGPGITPEDASHVFEPFYRSSSTSARAPGIGVGLAVCKRLIEADGGRIWFASRTEGSTFAFALPLARGDAADEQDSTSPRGVRQSARGRR